MLKTLTDTVSSNERIKSLDIIRGFALFGVLVVNMGSGSFWDNDSNGWLGTANQIVSWFVRFFMTHKFVSIYSFLFGIGFAIQLIRAENRKTNFISLYFRRLLILYLIGVVNFVLTDGDILQEYAMVAVLLLLLYKLPKNWFWVLALLYVLVPRVTDMIKSSRNEMRIRAQLNSKIHVDSSILDKYVGTYSFPGASIHTITRKSDSLLGAGRSSRYQLIPQSYNVFFRSDKAGVYTFLKDTNEGSTQIIFELPSGRKVQGHRIDSIEQNRLGDSKSPAAKKGGPKTYMQLIQTNSKKYWDDWKNWSWTKFFLGLDITLPLFLMGLYVGRRKVFNNISANQDFLKTAMTLCFFIGLTGTAISTSFDVWNYYNHISSQSYNYLIKGFVELSWMLGLMALGLGYVAKLALLLENEIWKNRLSFLAPVGRMGLTNYIIQSFLVTLTINSFGFNLGNESPFFSLLLSVLYFFVLVLISKWWFKHFLFGPLEWVWRSITYLKIQPMKAN